MHLLRRDGVLLRWKRAGANAHLDLGGAFARNGVFAALDVLSYTGIDIIAEPFYASYYSQYFIIWQVMLGILAMGLWRSSGSKPVALSFVAFAWSGAEDAPCYFLQLSSVPAELPWLTSPLVIQPGGTSMTTVLGFAWGSGLMAFAALRASRKRSMSGSESEHHGV